YASARIWGNTVDVPFNKDGYRYYIVEENKNVYDKNYAGDDYTTVSIQPAHIYRISDIGHVALSPNDRAHQLRMSDGQLVITGHEGYCMARASHSVATGKWHFEVEFKKAIGDCAIGWAQQYAAVQACVGYSKFSYGWRSQKGTKFHNGFGKTYCQPGFREGDILGCLISLPFDPLNPGPDSSKYLPNSGKDMVLIKYKNNNFFEEYEDSASVGKTLEPLKGSYIEFFRNGVSCGQALTDIYGGFYFPAISIFRQATLKMNFGPSFTHPPPKDVKAMSERPEELAVEQTLSDMLYTVDKNFYRQN
ncbi:hypothetical protein PENTCL1PPCAC_27008, partial [Pristionchus entomophagus]